MRETTPGKKIGIMENVPPNLNQENVKARLFRNCYIPSAETIFWEGVKSIQRVRFPINFFAMGGKLSPLPTLPRSTVRPEGG